MVFWRNGRQLKKTQGRLLLRAPQSQRVDHPRRLEGEGRWRRADIQGSDAKREQKRPVWSRKETWVTPVAEAVVLPLPPDEDLVVDITRVLDGGD